jgi:hypothetical protein
MGVVDASDAKATIMLGKMRDAEICELSDPLVSQ